MYIVEMLKHSGPRTQMICIYVFLFFSARKSCRKTARQLAADEQKQLKDRIQSGCQEGLEVANFEGKGRGWRVPEILDEGNLLLNTGGNYLG